MKVQTDLNRSFRDDISIKSSDEEDKNEFQSYMDLDNETGKSAIENFVQADDEERANEYADE